VIAGKGYRLALQAKKFEGLRSMSRRNPRFNGLTLSLKHAQPVMTHNPNVVEETVGHFAYSKVRDVVTLSDFSLNLVSFNKMITLLHVQPTAPHVPTLTTPVHSTTNAWAACAWAPLQHAATRTSLAPPSSD
jgi:hypothetical protein